MPEAGNRTQCERCGTCCRKGGPALHRVDLPLLQTKRLSRQSLITIRRGEPVNLPDRNAPVWTGTELVKLAGKPSEWTCIFYDRTESSCAIYQHRPRECVLLKCWDTTELQDIAGKNLLNRFDIIAPAEPVVKYIRLHEEVCSLEPLSRINLDRLPHISQRILAELNDLVNRDIAIRTKALRDLGLNLELELFYFGRPLFTVLTQFSLIPREVNGNITMIATRQF